MDLDLTRPFGQLLVGWAAMAVLMGALYLVGRRTRNHGIVDVGWAAGMGLLAVGLALAAPSEVWRRALVGGLAGAWALRLAWFLFFDRFLGREEDGRYQMMRESLGTRAEPVFFVFFQIQALWTLLFIAPVMVALWNPRAAFGVWEVLGIIIWAIAVGGESLADRQLARWKSNPANKGRTCRAGLWRYSRHPNYFFEWVHWFAYVALAVGSPLWWVSLMGPVVMLVFLFKVTGIPWTEKRALASRGDDYRRYQQTTSIFIPLPPRGDKATT